MYVQQPFLTVENKINRKALECCCKMQIASDIHIVPL